MSELEVRLVPTSGAGEGKLRVALVTGKRYPLEAFLEYCEQGSTITTADARAVLDSAASWIATCAKRGRTCDLGPLGHSRLALRGAFESRPKKIMDKDVTLKATWVLSRQIKNQVIIAGRALVRKKVAPDHGAKFTIVESFDSKLSGWQANTWRAGAVLRIRGARLKFDSSQTDEGVFVSAKGKHWTRLTTYQDVRPAEVRAVVPPELARSGTLKLAVRNRRQKNSEAVVSSEYTESLSEA